MISTSARRSLMVRRATLGRRSPTSLRVTLRQRRRGAGLTDFAGAVAMEYRLSQRFIAGQDFYEGVRAGEDTDFSWRIQAAGWRLELRSEASVEHRYRTTLKDLRSQWRGP